MNETEAKAIIDGTTPAQQRIREALNREAKDRRHARIGALTDSQRRTLLAYLCDSVPIAVDMMLDRLEGDWRRWQAAAQATEGNDG